MGTQPTRDGQVQLRACGRSAAGPGSVRGGHRPDLATVEAVHKLTELGAMASRSTTTLIRRTAAAASAADHTSSGRRWPRPHGGADVTPPFGDPVFKDVRFTSTTAPCAATPG